MAEATRFSLFNTKEKKHDRSPDMSGEIEIPVSQLDELRQHMSTQAVMNWNNEPVIKLRISGWNSESKNGLKYIGGLISVPMQEQQQHQEEEL